MLALLLARRFLRDEVLVRLLELNEQCHKEELLAGSSEPLAATGLDFFCHERVEHEDYYDPKHGTTKLVNLIQNRDLKRSKT